MKHAAVSMPQDPQIAPKLPAWARKPGCETLEEAAFASGAALATLGAALGHDDLPLDLLRDRLCLRAAEICVALTGRSERAAALRDEVHLLRPGDLPGPAGAVFMQWRRAAARRTTGLDLRNALPEEIAARLPEWATTGTRTTPLAQASQMLETVLAEFPRAEITALILADAVLSRALGWRRILPLLAIGLQPRDLRLDGDALRLACHRAVAGTVPQLLHEAADLTRRANRLRHVAPKLRAKGSDAAVALFLASDALSPAIALTAPGIAMSDRAARRFCDRLVELDVARELTGRPSFRLYGV
ncbi:DUF1403 family protein [Pseudooceanicola sp.]|uniref:DUF1403 family protein n=1 Tax=Pseudooceanicola sp. TaxID=1914328 RepID=UPI0035157682